MSWDVMLFKEKFDIEKETVVPLPLGTREMIIKGLENVLGTLNNPDSTCIVYKENDLGLEIMFGKGANVDNLSIYFHGNGNASKILKDICLNLGCVALDIASTEFIDFDSADKYWGNFLEYRNHMTGKAD